jgi:hypothetical protein
LSCVFGRDSEFSFAANMPIALPVADTALQYFMVAIILNGKYYLFGYTGLFNVSDLAYDIMNIANGHMVALPGASDNCFFYCNYSCLDRLSALQAI